jgi:hypothetical protein
MNIQNQACRVGTFFVPTRLITDVQRGHKNVPTLQIISPHPLAGEGQGRG